jgi:hypothetical protein
MSLRPLRQNKALLTYSAEGIEMISIKEKFIFEILSTNFPYILFILSDKKLID